MAKLSRRLMTAVNSVLRPTRMEIRERVPDYVESHGLRFRVTSDRTRKRASSLLTKEPATIAWIDGFSPGEVFWDVGANVGVYTLYAAKRGCEVFAFEPAYFNFGVLSDNIVANGMSDRVSAYCIALGDTNGIDDLNLSSTDPGSSLHSFSEPITYTGETFSPVARCSVLGMTADAFAHLRGARAPHHIKIDVDGNEAKVLAGAPEVLSRPELSSAMVELNTAWKEQMESAHGVLTSAGLVLSNQAASNTADVQNFFYVRPRD